MTAQQILRAHIATIRALPVRPIIRAAGLLRFTWAAGGTVYLCGNGGSAADCQHLAADLPGRAVALTTDTSVVTAIANDEGYAHVFSVQLELLAKKGDALIAISTSGQSANVLNAAIAAKMKGCAVIALTGERGAMLVRQSDVAIMVSSHVTARIQEAHITIGHMLCELVH